MRCVVDAQLERRARIKMPGLGLRDAVPARDLAALQQEIDRRRGAVAKGFAEAAALRVPFETQKGSDFRASHPCGTVSRIESRAEKPSYQAASSFHTTRRADSA